MGRWQAGPARRMVCAARARGHLAGRRGGGAGSLEGAARPVHAWPVRRPREDRRRGCPRGRPGPRQWRACALALAAVLGAPSAGRALDPDRAITQYVHDAWQTEQGLPQNTVQAVVQTRDGYLWLGTEEGLVRFDGVRFSVLDRRTAPELGHDDVVSLLEDGAGRLWVGTGGGLVRLEGGSFTRCAAANGQPGGRVVSLLEDRGHRLWVGTQGGGLARVEGDRLVSVLAFPAADGGPEVRPGRHVQALVEDGQGALWVGSETGLVRVKDGKARLFTKRDGLADDRVQAVREDGGGRLWVGTAGGGLDRLEGGRFVPLAAPGGPGRDVVQCLLEDRQGNLWIGTSAGLFRYRDGRARSFTTRDGLTRDLVEALFEDREGSLWVGTSGGGLNRLRDGRFTTLTTREGLSNDVVQAVFEDRKGVLWIGTDGGGLNRLSGGRLTALTTRTGLPSDLVVAVAEDREGVLWIGTDGGGVARLAHGRLTTLTTRDGLPSDSVRVVLVDRAGSVWIGTDGGGLGRLRDGRLTTFTTRDGLTSDVVYALLEDREGTLWIGTEGGGLNRLRDGVLGALTTRDGLSNDTVLALHEDEDGCLWIGTEGGGLNRLRQGRLAAVTSRQGLFDDKVFAILEDGRGQLWMSSNKGIFRAARAELEAVASGARERVVSIAYGTSDGMRSTEASGGTQPAGWRTRDGRLWFATIRGVVRVDPAHLPSNPVPPPVNVEEVLVDDRPAPRGAALRVRPGAHTVAIRYTAPSLVDPPRVAFRYRLEGFDEGWVEAGSRRTAYYTKIPPGEYRFHVVAANDDGLWNEAGATLAVTAEPRLHQARWFRLLVALAAGASLLAAHRLRVWRLRARERELVALVEERTRSLREEKEKTEAALGEAEAERARAEEASRAKSTFLANMSHELRTPLNGVLGFAQLMDRRSGRDGEDRASLATILRSGEHLLGLINDVLSLSKIEAGRLSLREAPFDLAGLVRGIEGMLRGRAEARGLALRCDVDPAVPPFVVGDEGKLRQVLINLLGNAVKFTTRGSVVLRARWEGGRAVFEVEDTGPGIAPEERAGLFEPFVQTETGRRAKEGTGLGLALSRQYARLMGGDVTLESEVGRGTCFRVEVALPEAPADAVVAARGERRRVRALAPGQPGRRVLVVDDVADNRVLLGRLLSSVGFEVEEAASGEEAVERWRSFAPHFIWMDKRMAGIDGLEATRRIRAEEAARPGGERVKIVALSASAMEHERGAILAAGCDDFEAKPFREGAIFGKLAEHLGVSYVYEETGPAPAAPEPAAPPTAAQLASLPPEWVAGMLDSLRAGELQRARALAGQVERSDAALARRLQAMIDGFQLDELEGELARAARSGPPPRP